MGDALGSVRQLVSANGAVTLTRSYEPFGSTLNSAGAGTTAFQFAGEARDASGLVFLRARYFSTATGRFFTQDSWPGNAQMPGTLHPYLYGLNNPVRYTDPSGQCFTGAVIDAIICGAVAGAVVGGAVGAAVEYGRQVYQNYQHGHRGSEAWAECIDWGSVGRSALRGAGAGAAAGAAAPAAAYLFASGLGAEIAIGAAGGAAGNAAIQIGANALSGRPLGEGVAQAAVEGAIVGGASAAVVGIGSRVLRATSGGVSGGGSSFARNANSFTDEELAILGPEAGGGGLPKPSAALGVNDKLQMSDFARRTNSSWYGQWEDVGLTDGSVSSFNFGPSFRQAMNRAGQIHFSLDGIIGDPVEFARLGGTGDFGQVPFTARELYLIGKKPEWLAKTVFYKGGEVVSAPRFNP